MFDRTPLHNFHATRSLPRTGIAALCAAVTAAFACAQPAPEPTPTPPPPPAAAEPTIVPDTRIASAPRVPPDDPRPPTGIEEELDLIRPGLAIKRKFDQIAD